MGILSTLIDGGVVGAIGGIFGHAVNGFISYKNKKLDLEDRKLERKHSLDEIQLEASVAVTVEKLKQTGEEEKHDASAYEKSMEGIGKILNTVLLKKEYANKIPDWMMGYIIAPAFALVDIARAAVRPFGTIYLLGLTSIMGIFLAVEQSELFMKQSTNIPTMLSNLTTMSYTWWFGDRRLAKSMREKN